MSIELVKESINSTKSYDAHIVQIPIKKDVIVPDKKPDIVKILQVDAKVILDDVALNDSKIRFTGKVDFNVLYLADGEGNIVHNIEVSYPISEVMNVDEISEDAYFTLDTYVENLRWELLNERKININAIIEVESMLEEKCCKEVLVDAKGLNDLQISRKTVLSRQMVCYKDEKFVIKDEIAVSSGKPNVDEVLWCDISIKNKDVKVLDDKVTLKGDLNVCILYTGESNERPLEYMETLVPFNGIIDAPGCTQEMYTDLNMKIDKHFIQVMPDMDGESRCFELEIIAVTNMKVYSTEQKSIIQDAYSPTKNLNIVYEPTKFENIIFKNQMKKNIMESIELGSSMPDIMQIFYVKATPKVDDYKISDDRVEVEGVVFVKVFYVAADDNNPICSYEAMVPFEEAIETRGAKEEHNCEIHSYIEYASCSMISTREVELRCNICFDTNILEEYDVNLLKNMEDEDKDIDELEAMPSMVIYIVGPEDSMWHIAKKYNTTIPDIMEINNLETDYLKEGQKLLIMKSVFED